MAQYDGSIRINTKINVKNAEAQLSTLENRIVKTSDKIASLRSKMDALKDVKIPTQEYDVLDKELSKLGAEYEKIAERQQRFLTAGGKEESSAYKRMEYDLDSLDKKQDRVIAKMKALEASGKAFTLGSDTEEFTKLSQQLQYAENDLSSLNQKHEVHELKLKKAKSEYRKLGNVATKSLQKIGSMVKNGAITPFKAFGNMAKSVFSNIGKSSKKTGSLLSTFGSRFKGIALSLLIFNQITKAFNAMVSGIKEGFGNLYNENVNFKSQVDSLRGSLLTLKNALAGAFAPIVSAAIPYIQQLIGWITSAVEAVGQFIAALTGKKTYTKAIKQTAGAFEDAAGAANDAKEAAEGYLSPLDDINKYSDGKDKAADAGSGSGVGSAGQMFEEVPVDNKFKDIAQWFKDMWEEADFTELGAILGQKLKSALDSIPWAPIQETAAKVGKSFATLINGFVEVPGLALSIGKTIGEAINTGIAGINSFLDNTHWNSVGKFIGNGLNGVVNAVNWKGLGHLFAQKWNAVFATIGEAARTFNWSNFGLELSNGINTAISDFNWAENGARLGDLVKGIFDTIINLLENTNWKELGEGVAGFIGAIDWSGIANRLFEGIGSAFGGIAAFLVGLFKDALSNFSEKYIQPYIQYAEDAGLDLFTGFLMGIGAAIADIGKWIYEHIFQPFIDGFKTAFEINSPSKVMQEMGEFLMEGLFNGISSLVDKVVSIFGTIKQYIAEKWEEVKTVTSSIWKSITSTITGIWNSIKAAVTTAINAVKTVISNIWNAIKTVTSTIWNGIKSTISGIWNGIKTMATTAFNNIKNTVVAAWNNLKTSTSNIWRGIVSAVKSPINTIIGFINAMIRGIASGVNSIAKMLNNLSIDVPQWVTDATGITSFGFNLPTWTPGRIPYLATGTVVPPNKEFLAVLGDNKREHEVVSPLSTIEQAVENVLARNGGTGNIGNITVQVVLDKKVVAQSVLDFGKMQQMSTGKNPFALGTT